MADRQFEIDIVVKARNAVGSALREVEKSIAELDKKFNNVEDTLNDVNKRIDESNKGLEELGHKGASRVDTLTSSTKELGDSLEEVEKNTLGVRHAARGMDKDFKFHRMTNEVQDLFVQLENANKALGKFGITPAKQAQLTRQINEIRRQILTVQEDIGGGKTRTVDRDFSSFFEGGTKEKFRQALKDFSTAKRKEAEKSGREIVAVNAKIESEIDKIVRESNKGRSAAVRNSVAQLADYRDKLTQLKVHEDVVNKQIADGLSRALGEVDTSKISKLEKAIQSVGLATTKQLDEKQRSRIEKDLEEISILQKRLSSLKDEKEFEADGLANQEAALRLLQEQESIQKRLDDLAEEKRQRELKFKDDIAVLDEKIARAKDKNERESFKNLLREIRFADKERSEAADREFSIATERLGQTAEGRTRANEYENAREKQRTALLAAGGIPGRRGPGSRFGTGGTGLALGVQHFQVAGAIKYFQALLTVAVSLGGALVAVAASAIGAAAALGGALVAGAAAAIGPLSVMVGVISRVTAVLQAVKLTNQIASRGDGASQKNNDSILNAQESLEDALRGVAKAQKDLTKARKDAADELKDLIYQEQKAKLATEGSGLSAEEAQRRLRKALAEGGAVDVAESQLGLKESQLNLQKSRADEAKAITDAADAKAKGIEGSDKVAAAQERLADALRAAARAQRALAAAQKDTGGATALQASRLEFLLGKLSPAEKRLYTALTRFQDEYRKLAQPITDTIINSITRGINAGLEVMRDPRVQASFGIVGDAMAKSLDKVVDFFKSDENINFVTGFARKGAALMEPLTRTFINLSKFLQRIADAARPVLDLVVGGFERLSEKLLKITGNTEGLDKFFKSSGEDLKAWAGLFESAVNLIASIFEPARESGRIMVNDLTKVFNGFADSARKNSKGVADFFEKSRKVMYALASVIKTLAIEINDAFSVQSVEAFASALNDVFIPALGIIIKSMGHIVQLFHEFIGNPVISFITRTALALAGMTYGFTILSSAFGKIIAQFEILIGFLIGKTEFKFVALAGQATKLGKTMTLTGLFFKRFLGVLILLQVASSVLGISLDKLAKYLGALSLAGAIAKFIQWAAAARGVSWAITGIGLAIKATPWGRILTLAAAAGAALLLFATRNKKVKDSAEETTKALNNQRKAIETLRTTQQEGKDSEFSLRRAKLDKASAKERLEQVEKDFKVGQATRRDVKIAELDLDEAGVRLTRARQNYREERDKAPGRTQKQLKDSAKGVDEATSSLLDAAGKTKEAEKKVETIRESINDARNALAKSPNERRATALRGEITGLTSELEISQTKLDAVKKKEVKAHRSAEKAIENYSKTYLEAIKVSDIFGGVSSDLFKYIQENASQVLGGYGIKTKDFFVPLAYKKHGSIGDVISSQSGEIKLAGGGIIDGYGLQDTVPVLAAPGEGFLNRHQMPVVDAALSMSGLMPGGLNQLFSEISTPHYMARGGEVTYPGLEGPMLKLAKLLGRQGFTPTSMRYDHPVSTTSGNISNHSTGHAADYGDSINNQSKLARTLWPIRKRLAELFIPTDATHGGLYHYGRPFENAGLQSQHQDHIHVAFLSGIIKSLAGVSDKVKKFSSKGVEPPMLKNIFQLGNNVIDRVNRNIAERIAASDPHTLSSRRGKFRGGHFEATSYGPPWGGIQGGGTTSTGIKLPNNVTGKAGPYIIAVDPRVIPYHSKLKIQPNPFGYKGAFKAEDTGGAIKDHRIDFLDMRGRKFQNKWGRRNVTVHNAAQGGIVGRISGQRPDRPDMPGDKKRQSRSARLQRILDKIWSRVSKYFPGGMPYTREDPYLEYNEGADGMYTYPTKRKVGRVDLSRRIVNSLLQQKNSNHHNVVLHEWAHAFQKNIGWASTKEGAATAFANLTGARVFKGILQKWRATSQSGYFEYVSKYLQKFKDTKEFKEFTLRGQFARGPLKEKFIYNKGGVVGGLRRFQSGGVVPFAATPAVRKEVRVPFSRDIERITESLSHHFGVILKTAKDGTKKTINYLSRATKAIRDLTAEDGPLGSFSGQFTSFQTKLSDKLKGKKFKATKKLKRGQVTVEDKLTDQAEREQRSIDLGEERLAIRDQRERAKDALETLEETKKGLKERRASLKKQLASKNLSKKKRDSLKTKLKLANEALGQNSGAIAKTTGFLEAAGGLLAENSSQQFEVQQQIRQDSIDSINAKADKANTGLDREQARSDAGLGGRSSTQINLARRDVIEGFGGQIAALEQQRHAAQDIDPKMAKEIQDKIDELNGTIQDLTIQQIDNIINESDKAAGILSGKADNADKLASRLEATNVIGFRAAAVARGEGLDLRGQALSTQAKGIKTAMSLLDPSSTRWQELNNQLEGLGEDIKMNTLEQEKNTTALASAEFAFQQSVVGFRTSVTGGAISIIKGVNDILGNPDDTLVQGLLTGNQATLGGARKTYIGSLNKLLESRGLGQIDSNLSGIGLAQALAALSNTDTSLWTPEDKTLFEGIITALISNEEAINSNTKELQAMAGTDDQSFTSTAWQLYRNAVFNGTGGLLPSMVPQMASGGTVLKDGMAYLHAAEVVVPAGRDGDRNSRVDVTINEAQRGADYVGFGNHVAFKLRELSNA